MKKTGIVVILLLAFGFVTACTKGYESRKSAGDLTITLKADRYPLVKGDNTLNAKITDSSGKPVQDANVNVRFYMPPMPGMAPMEFKFQPQMKGGGYPFTVNVPMEGGWKVEVTAARPGKAPVTATFNVDAR